MLLKRRGIEFPEVKGWRSGAKRSREERAREKRAEEKRREKKRIGRRESRERVAGGGVEGREGGARYVPWYFFCAILASPALASGSLLHQLSFP